MEVKIEKSWNEVLNSEFQKAYFKDLTDFVREEYSKYPICPRASLIFNAFNLTPFDKVKVVILGQDPYHTRGVANGLAFSSDKNNRIPPSLKNIFKEIHNDLGKEIPNHPDLTRWAKQGVLLLNTTLTVREGKPLSHKDKGWEKLSDYVIKAISDNKENVVFLLWGNFARSKKVLIDINKHLVLESPHPSPFSADRGFFGCKHFSLTNEYLKSKGIEEIDW